MAVIDTVERIVFQGVDQLTGVALQGKKSVDDLKVALSSVQSALAGIGVAVGAGAFVQLQLEALHAVAALDDMAEATGASVEKLSAIQNVAKVGGQDFEGLTAQLGRMTKGLKENKEEGTTAAKALAVLGISAKDANGRWRDSAQVLIDVANRLKQYEDGAGKVAIIQDILGKGAEKYLPLLKDIAAGTDLTSKVTGEMAAKAEEAEKSMNRLKVSIEELRKEFVIGLVPALTTAADFLKRIMDIRPNFAELARTAAAMSPLHGDAFEASSKRINDLTADIDALIRKQKEYGELSKQGGAFGARAAQSAQRLGPQIESLRRERELMKFIQERSHQENAPGGAMDMGVGLDGVFRHALEYQQDDPRRLKPSDIAKMNEEAMEELRKGNAQMDVYLDKRQKDLIAQQEAAKDASRQNDAALAEQDLARLDALDQARADRLKNIQGLRLQAAADELKAEEGIYQEHLTVLGVMTDQELEAYGGRLAVKEALYADHTARLNYMDQRRNEQLRSMEMNTWQLAGNFLQLFAGKSRAAAIAVIAIQKGLAIAQVVVNTEAAIMRAYAELGPIAGTAMTAALRTQEALSIGLIGATGLVEASQAGSGGAGAPSAAPSFAPAARPVFQADPFIGTPAPPRQSITVIFQGEDSDRVTVGQVREFAEAMADASEAGALIFVERKV
jgi:hypothetical protein